MNAMATLSPWLIWVVGDNTNVGKTTVSASLLRVLNAAGKSAIGFKPYAGARLVEVMDLLEEVAVGDGLLVGRDARKLVSASPRVPPDWLEVVNPSWRLSHPSRDASAFIRKGSALVGRRSFCHTANTQALWRRPDLQSLNQRMHLPVASCGVTPDRPADEVDFADQPVQQASFNRLLTLQPDIVVCEGAGRLLPVWQGAPPVRHLFFISSGDLHLFPNVGIRFTGGPTAFGPYTTAALVQQLKGRAHLRAPIPLLHAAALDAGMDAFLQRFVKACLDTPGTAN